MKIKSTSKTKWINGNKTVLFQFRHSASDKKVRKWAFPSLSMPLYQRYNNWQNLLLEKKHPRNFQLIVEQWSAPGHLSKRQRLWLSWKIFQVTIDSSTNTIFDNIIYEREVVRPHTHTHSHTNYVTYTCRVS